jgi:hypothetical protein
MHRNLLQWPLTLIFKNLLLIVIIMYTLGCGFEYPDDFAMDGIKKKYNITDIKRINIIKKYKRENFGETVYVYKFTIDKQDKLDYIAVSTFGGSKYSYTILFPRE